MHPTGRPLQRDRPPRTRKQCTILFLSPSAPEWRTVAVFLRSLVNWRIVLTALAKISLNRVVSCCRDFNLGAFLDHSARHRFGARKPTAQREQKHCSVCLFPWNSPHRAAKHASCENRKNLKRVSSLQFKVLLCYLDPRLRRRQ